MAFERLEPFGWESWALFFGRLCEQISVAIGVIAKIKYPVKPWHFFFRPPYGFAHETDEARVKRLNDYDKSAEELEAEQITDEDMAAAAEARAAAFQEALKKKAMSNVER